VRKKRLLLLGGGHAHVQVVRAFAAAPPQDTEVTLLSEARRTPYSGMLPGLIAGHYTHDEAHIDLASLCEASGASFVERRASALHPAGATVETDTGEHHVYDVLSIDTGSNSPLGRVHGAAAHAVPVKPVPAFLSALETLDRSVASGGTDSVAVVGAGAAGFEVVLALAHRLRSRLVDRPSPSLHLVTDAHSILPELPPRVRRLGLRALAAHGVEVHTGRRVEALTAQGLRLVDGACIRAAPVFFVTGAEPASMYRAAGIATDARGFVAVHPTLQSISHPDIFACGDVAAVIEHPRPKAGVFAVRQGAALTANLRRALERRSLAPFQPQRAYLVLLSTGEKHAIATRNGLTLHGRWVWRWKDWIDRRFVERFRPAAVARRRT
jgi:selenide,water dikinase